MFSFSRVVSCVLYSIAVTKYWKVAFVDIIEIEALYRRGFWSCNKNRYEGSYIILADVTDS